MTTRFKRLWLFFLIFNLIVFTPSLKAQDQDEKILELESRVRALENATSSLQSTVNDSSANQQSELDNFKEQIDKGLQDFSKDLQMNLDERLRGLDEQTVVLNLASKAYQQIKTNSGVFLVSLQKTERLSGGYRLILHVGNPNFAGYQGIRFKLSWGKKWDPNSIISYNSWRQSLTGGEYFFNGKLDSGSWTEIALDIAPATTKELEYIECSMAVDSIQLNLKKPD